MNGVSSPSSRAMLITPSRIRPLASTTVRPSSTSAVTAARTRGESSPLYVPSYGKSVPSMSSATSLTPTAR